MKKRSLSLLIIITCLFGMFTLGFFLGRNLNHETVYASGLSREPQHNQSPAVQSIHETEAASVVSFPININTAGLEELTALPGIGETLAKRVLTYRDANGRFERPEELLNVDGIGPGKLEEMLDYVITGG